MSAATVLEGVLGGLLLFLLPGVAVAKALFPERRARGPGGVRWMVELAGLGVVLSVVFTVLVGYLLLSLVPGGFSASWANPELEVGLGAILLVAFALGVLRGAYRREPPPASGGTTAQEPEDAWELGRRLDRLQRERLGLERQIAAAPSGSVDLRERLEGVLAEERSLREAREAEYDL